MKQFDNVFLEFPLCVLLYLGNDKQKLEEVFWYSQYESYIKNNLVEGIEIYIDKVKEVLANEEYMKSAKGYFENKWYKVKCFIDKYEIQNGNDAHFRIGQQFLLDTINGKVSYREFQVLCAINSIIGKKKVYCSITYDRISYCMLGFRKRDIAVKDLAYQSRLSNRQIAITVNKLKLKRFFTTTTYFREKYYSTRIKTVERLQEVIALKKYKRAEIKNNIANIEWARTVHNEIKRIKKEQMLNRYFLDGTLPA